MKQKRAERILTKYLNCPLGLHVSDPLPPHFDFPQSCNWFFNVMVGHNFLGKIICIWNRSWNWSYQLIKFKIMKWFSKTHHILHRPIIKDKWECEQHHSSTSFEPFRVRLTSAIPSINTVRFQFRLWEGGQVQRLPRTLPTIITITSWIRGALHGFCRMPNMPIPSTHSGTGELFTGWVCRSNGPLVSQTSHNSLYYLIIINLTLVFWILKNRCESPRVKISHFLQSTITVVIGLRFLLTRLKEEKW